MVDKLPTSFADPHIVTKINTINSIIIQTCSLS